MSVNEWKLTSVLTLPLLLIVMAAVAILVPARRATRLDPVNALGEE